MMSPDFSMSRPFAAVRTQPVLPPVGTVIAYAGPVSDSNNSGASLISVAPGWLVCNGAAALKSQYYSLFRVLGTRYGTPSDDGSFLLPDYRGTFLRAVDAGRGLDPDASARTGSGPDGGGATGDEVGSFQAQQFQEHEHHYAPGATTSEFLTAGEGTPGPGLEPSTEGTTTSVVCEPESPPCFGDETRPVNLYVYFLIKASTSAGHLAVPAIR